MTVAAMRPASATSSDVSGLREELLRDPTWTLNPPVRTSITVQARAQTVSASSHRLRDARRFRVVESGWITASLQLHHGPDAPPILEVSQSFQIEEQQAFNDPDAFPVRKLVVVVHDDVPDVLASQ